MQSKIQQSGHFLLSGNYTNIKCLEDLHTFASETAEEVIVTARAASLQSHGTFVVLQATNNLKSRRKTANISHNLQCFHCVCHL